MLAVGVGVVAGAEQRKIVGCDPLQKLDRFGDLIGRQRRRIGAQLGRDLAGARQHRTPVLHADAHVGEHALDRADDFGLRAGVFDVGGMDVDEAFALTVASAYAPEVNEPSARIALDGENGMRQEPDIETALG